jgi:hypothetical protein
VKAKEAWKLQEGSKTVPQFRCRWGLFRKWVLGVTLFALTLAAAPAALTAQQGQAGPRGKEESQRQVQPAVPREPTHRFFDKTNLALFAGVAAVRTLDFTSTEHFRAQGNNEVLLTNSIVDNKALFAGIEVAGVAASIGVSYWLHRTGHHKLERWVSIVHIGIGAFGAAHNYSLSPAQ